MIQNRPKLCGKKLVYKALLFLIIAAMALMIAPIFGKYSAVAQLVGFVCATYSLYIIIKYVVTDYLYTLEDGHLTIHKVNRSQSVCVADIELDSVITLYRNEDIKKASHDTAKTYTFIKNPGGADVSTIIFTLSDENYAVVFEPDDLFYRQLETEILNTKNNYPEDEEKND